MYDNQFTQTLHNERLQEAANDRRFIRFGTVEKNTSSAEGGLLKAITTLGKKLNFSAAFQTRPMRSVTK